MLIRVLYFPATMLHIKVILVGKLPGFFFFGYNQARLALVTWPKIPVMVFKCMSTVTAAIFLLHFLWSSTGDDL